MNALIKVDYTAESPTVSARELHEFLVVETPFRLWFPRMTEYGFTEGADYTPYNFVHPQNGQPTTDYQLALPMAKELCMIQRTERGKQARQYFLSVESAWNTPEMVMARAITFAQKRISGLEESNTALLTQIEQDKPKVRLAEAVTSSTTSILVGEMAKVLRQNGVDIGRDRLFAWLRDNGYLIKSGAERNIPTQRAMDLGLFEIRYRPVTYNGEEHTARTPMVTGRGVQYFINRFTRRQAI